MKKFGFTLAEVLITLTIIGVVAAVTLPALQANVQEQATISRYKKTMNTLNTVGGLAQAEFLFSYSDCLPGAVEDDNRGLDNNGALRRQLWAVFDRYAKLDRSAMNNGNLEPGGWCANGRTENVVYFKDGTLFCWDTVTHNSGNEPNIHFGAIDTNGVRPPNTLSSCTDVNCATGKNINDQFMVSLTADEAFPGYVTRNENGEIVRRDNLNLTQSNASQWALNR